MNTNFEVMGLTRLGIKHGSTAPETHLNKTHGPLSCVNVTIGWENAY